MMTSSRPRDVGGSFSARRGHTAKLSISDPTHHVTEAIGTMYGDDSDYSPSDSSRPASFADEIPQNFLSPDSVQNPPRLVRSSSDQPPSAINPQAKLRKSMTFPSRISSPNRNTFEPRSPMSPTLADVQQDAAGSQYPLTHIDSPNDIAQELSNLQALRRISMDVGNTSDPDLMFSSMSMMAVPSVAPTGNDDGTDPSRLLWVPARVHPELAPMEFKDFLEKRVQSMKRRSIESSLSVDSLDVTGSAGGHLRRKKSMLSRQIDRTAADVYVDGAERLERKKSVNGAPKLPELTLDELVKDPTKAVRKLQGEAEAEKNASEDMPILPVAPGIGLRRATRTQYRKGGSLSKGGNRLPFSKRVAQKAAEAENVDAPQAPKIPGPESYGLDRVQSEPVSENFSRPSRSVRRQHKFSQDSTGSTKSSSSHDDMELDGHRVPDPLPTVSAPAGNSRTIPNIVETPPLDQDDPPQVAHPTRIYSHRSPSQTADTQMMSQPVLEESAGHSSKRPVGRPLNTPQSIKQSAQQLQHGKSLDEITQHPYLPGGGNTRTDSLSFIPTFSSSDEKKEKKSKKDKDRDDTESVSSTKSSGWKWFKGGNDEKQRRKKEEEETKKAKAKAYLEKATDNVRLDALDTAIGKGRESLVMDRDNIDNRLHEERKKDGHKKNSESKKEKDGIFASIFGGGKKKGDKDKDSSKKHHHHREPSPEPYRDLRPDVDYNWTRFPLIKERAIYRLAHMKLANPRRSLHSQVLLSNFMYSYLAKVQAMHPQIQVPQSPQQKRLEQERRRKEQEEAYLLEQQMIQDAESGNIDQYNFEYHRNTNQYGDSPISEQDGEYDDGGEYYEQDDREGSGRDSGEDVYGRQTSRSGGREYYSHGNGEAGQQRDDQGWR